MKKLTALFLTVIMTFVCFAALAEGTISVSGTGETRVSADAAVISLGVSARNREVLKAQQQVNQNIAAIRKALLEEKIPEENIHTEFINIYATYDYSNDLEQLAAYHAGSTLAIRVNDMEKVGKIIDVCFAAGANTLNGISFSATDTEEAKAVALKKAVEDARKKAEILAEASGQKITGIQSISEGGVYSFENNIGNVYARGTAMMEEADAGTVVQSAKLVVSASVSITFTVE